MAKQAAATGAGAAVNGKTRLATAEEHRAADERCGRAWVCMCGACKPLRNSAAELAKALQAVMQQEKSGHPSVCRVAVGGQCSCWLSLARAALKKAGAL